MTNTTEEKILDNLEADTVQKIDYIIRGLELGKYDEAAKKVEFLGKLTGDKSPQYIAKLLLRISTLENTNITQSTDITNLTYKNSQLETDNTIIENKVIKLETDMTTVAKAIRLLFEPNPLSNTYHMTEINTFCNNHNAPSY